MYQLRNQSMEGILSLALNRGRTKTQVKEAKEIAQLGTGTLG